MSRRSGTRCIPVSVFASLVVCALFVGVATMHAATAAGPIGSHTVSASVRAVQPAVSGLFQVHTPRIWMDALDGAGVPGKNGVPDFLDSWDAFTARTSSAILKSGYAFTTIDRVQHEILYAGLQRGSAGGPGSAAFEFAQKADERTPGDLRISVEIDAAGSVGAVQFESLAAEGNGWKFLPIAILAGEGCNDAGSACVAANGALLEVGYNLTALGKPEKGFAIIRITTPEDSVVGTFSINPVTLPSVTCPSNLQSCTANDVTTTVKAVTILNNDLCTSLTDTIQLQITTAYASTSNSRFDLGLFVSRDGGTVQEPSTAVACSGAAALVGQGNNTAYPDSDADLFLSIDPSGHSSTPSVTDTCGDLSANAGPVDWTVNATVECNIVNGALRIPSCRVWEQNANHKTSCTSLQQAGTGSKCDCNDLVVTTQLNPCATTICNDNNVCTDDSCQVVGTPGNLSAHCVYTNDDTNVCDDGNACTVGDACSAGACVNTPANCDDSNLCTTDSCNPASGCAHANNTNPCDDGNACTIGDACSGGACAAGGAANCDDQNVCTNDSCNPASGCAHANNTADCSTGAEGGSCDAQDKCEGGTCVEKYKSSSTVCRSAAGVCDQAESCTGTSAACPDDAFLSAATECRASGGVCDPAESCTGNSATCPNDAKSTAVCRASAGVCDVAESCDGTNNACPNDQFLANTNVCRSAAGVCDIAESCTGSSATCPNDSKSTAVCRAKEGVCDVAESCDGVNNACPQDAVVAASANVVCRGSDGSPCDPVEYCDGVNKSCGPDLCAGGQRPDVSKDICSPPAP